MEYKNMKNKPISNTTIKKFWIARFKIFGISRQQVLNFNSGINKGLRAFNSYIKTNNYNRQGFKKYA